MQEKFEYTKGVIRIRKFHDKKLGNRNFIC
jgi:hypothetical protein